MAEKSITIYRPFRRGAYKPDSGASADFEYIKLPGSFSNRSFSKSFSGGGGVILSVRHIRLFASFHEEFDDEFDTGLGRGFLSVNQPLSSNAESRWIGLDKDTAIGVPIAITFDNVILQGVKLTTATRTLTVSYINPGSSKEFNMEFIESGTTNDFMQRITLPTSNDLTTADVVLTQQLYNTAIEIFGGTPFDNTQTIDFIIEEV